MKKLLMGAVVLSVAGLVWTVSHEEARAQEANASFPAPVSADGVANRLGCMLLENDGMETEVGFWPCIQAWVYADFGALKSGKATEVPAYVVAQMKSSSLSDKMGHIFFDNWTVSRMEKDGEDFISVHGWGFKKNGYQMRMENFVPFKQGEHMTSFITTTPDGSMSKNYTMRCFMDFDSIQ